MFVPGGRRTTVGTYLMDTQPNHFEWTLEGISWKGAISVLSSVACSETIGVICEHVMGWLPVP